MAEDFLLKWNDHHSLFFVGAEELCESEEYTDVTLAAGTKFFAAHKLVLSICSPYFKRLFKRLGKDKPVIFLKDVDQRHLDLLLQYMYKGEIKVQEDELVAVLNTAQGLEIKGLSENSTSSDKGQATPDRKVHNPPLPVKRTQIETETAESGFKRRKILHYNEVKGESQMARPLLNPPAPHSSSLQAPEALKVKEELTPITIDQDIPDQGDQNGQNGQNGECGEMGQELSYCQDLAAGFDMREVDRAFEGDFYQEGAEHLGQFENGTESTKICPYCQKEFKKLSSLKQHLPVHTKEKNFECNICNASYTRSSSLYSHMRQKHQSMETQEFHELID